eukprot:9003551-Heterocapsa_arctica.AAC.1
MLHARPGLLVDVAEQSAQFLHGEGGIRAFRDRSDLLAQDAAIAPPALVVKHSAFFHVLRVHFRRRAQRTATLHPGDLQDAAPVAIWDPHLVLALVGLPPFSSEILPPLRVQHMAPLDLHLLVQLLLA